MGEVLNTLGGFCDAIGYFCIAVVVAAAGSLIYGFLQAAWAAFRGRK